MIRQCLLLIAFTWCCIAGAVPVGTSFTYQGELLQSGAPVNGSFDFQFRLFDAPSNGSETASSIFLSVVAVQDGIFTVELDFGSAPFAGDAMWLDISVRDSSSADPYTPLAPRQPIRPAPYALHAEFVGMDAVGSSNIANSSIEAVDLAPDSVGSSEIQNFAVGESELGSGAVTSNKIGNSAVTRTRIATDAVGEDAVDASEVQLRVQSTCDRGAIAEIQADGNIVCSESTGVATALSASAQTNRTLDNGTGSGVWPHMRRNPVSGLPAIAHFDEDAGDLRFTACVNPECEETVTNIVDSNGVTGNYPSLDFTSDGQPVMTYYDVTNEQLKYAICDDPQCDSFTRTVLDSNGDVGQYSTLRVLGNNVFVAYYDADNGNLKFARCTDLNCAGRSVIDADTSANDVGQYASMGSAVGQLARFLIAYYDATAGDLKTVVCTNSTNITCATPVVRDNSGTTGLYPKVVTAAFGLPIVAYATTSRMKLLLCTATTISDPCSAATIVYTSPSATGSVQPYVLDMVLDPAGHPVIMTQNGSFFRCADAFCSRVTDRITTSSGPGSTEKGVSMLARDNGTVVWARQSANRLRLGSCRNRFCVDASMD